MALINELITVLVPKLPRQVQTATLTIPDFPYSDPVVTEVAFQEPQTSDVSVEMSHHEVDLEVPQEETIVTGLIGSSSQTTTHYGA